MSLPDSLLLATGNLHKVREFERLLAPVGIDPLPEGIVLPPETGTTYADNALIKARAAAFSTGRLVIADDSGIEAEALRGAPGVRSARFAHELATDAENLELLLEKAPAGSRLEYVCVIAAVDPVAGTEQLFEGRCAGVRADRPAGSGGFGYDPAFVPADGADGRTMAELNDREKDAISHRGRAARALLAALGRSDGA